MTSAVMDSEARPHNALPTFSVIIPTRHRDGTLAECLQRLAPGRQILRAEQYEVIVTDDGSASNAKAMIDERFPWARWTAGPRRGPAANRNHGASIAQYEWLVFTDDDCLPASAWLAEYAAMIKSGAGSILEGCTTCEDGVRPLVDEAPVNTRGGNLWSCNLAIRRDVFDRLGRFDERFPAANAEDLEFADRIRRVPLAVKFVPTAIVDHPRRPRRGGVVAGRMWESRALLKEFDSNTLPGWMPLHVAKIRMAQLLATRPSREWIRFAWSSGIEVMTVLLLYRRWARRFAGATPIQPARYGETRD